MTSNSILAANLQLCIRTNVRQDIRHLRIRYDAERLASTGRAEPED